MYSVGDRVNYSGAYPATVTKVISESLVRVKFDNERLIPPEMDVNTDMLVSDPNDHCPMCHKKWNRTEGFLNFYYDCLSCGIKKEEAF